MKKYHVKVAVQILEIYEVEAEDTETALICWDEGQLIHTCDEAIECEPLSAEEVQP
jgi:hypothetical protein